MSKKMKSFSKFLAYSTMQLLPENNKSNNNFESFFNRLNEINIYQKY